MLCLCFKVDVVFKLGKDVFFFINDFKIIGRWVDQAVVLVVIEDKQVIGIWQVKFGFFQCDLFLVGLFFGDNIIYKVMDFLRGFFWIGVCQQVYGNFLFIEYCFKLYFLVVVGLVFVIDFIGEVYVYGKFVDVVVKW